MGLADKSTFYYLIKPNKDAQGVLYPISTMKPTDLSKTLAQLSKPEYIDQVLAYLQQFNSSVGGLVGSGATAPQAQMPQGMSMGGSFDNPNAAQPEIQQMSVPPGMEQAMGAQPNGNQDKGSSSFGAKETSKELVSGVDDLKLSNEDNLRIRNYVGGKGAGAARSLAQYASLAYGISTTQAAMYIANASGTNTAVGEQLRRLGNQLKAGKFKPAFKFISKVQDALVGNFVKSNASLDLPNNPSEFASIVQSDPKIKDKWTDFTSDNNETSEAFTEYLEERDDEDEDEDDGKN